MVRGGSGAAASGMERFVMVVDGSPGAPSWVL